MTCTFFGHRDCPSSVCTLLRPVLEDLIIHHSADHFYVGNQGRFDFYVLKTLRVLQKEHPHIRVSVVLAYLPDRYSKEEIEKMGSTILPEGIEDIPPRFAISYRNKWMLQRSEWVVGYVWRTFGGAATFFRMAERKKKQCVNLAESK